MKFVMEYEGKMVTVEDLAAIRRARFSKITRPPPTPPPPLKPVVLVAPYYVEVVWNRDFDFRPVGHRHPELSTAVVFAESMQNLGDGASVKKARVVDSEGNVAWQYGKLVNTPPA